MTDAIVQAHGEPVLRVVPEPSDINANGHIFGGWVLAMMDRAGGIVAGRVAQGRCATVAIESMEFLAPIHLGDLISIYGHVERRGRTSMAIRLNVVAERGRGKTVVDVTTGLFTFVALDENFRPTPLPQE
jgi:acyl-CoA thioesterase YciA